MKECTHKKLMYIGRQETLKKGIYLYLCNCLDCDSTIHVPKKSIIDTTGAIFRNTSKLTQVYDANHPGIKK